MEGRLRKERGQPALVGPRLTSVADTVRYRTRKFCPQQAGKFAKIQLFADPHQRGASSSVVTAQQMFLGCKVSIEERLVYMDCRKFLMEKFERVIHTDIGVFRNKNANLQSHATSPP